MQRALPLVLVPLWSYSYIPTSEEKLPFPVDGSRYFNTGKRQSLNKPWCSLITSFTVIIVDVIMVM